MSVTTVRLQPEIESGLEAAADKLHRSKSWIINQAVGEYVARLELAQTRWAETLEAIDSAAKGEVVSGESAIEWLKSWGTPNELPPPKVGG